jgi:hypothetical protein
VTSSFFSFITYASFLNNGEIYFKPITCGLVFLPLLIVVLYLDLSPVKELFYTTATSVLYNLYVGGYAAE